MSLEDLKIKIIGILSKRGGMSFEELLAELGWSGDLRVLRRVIAEMIREGVIVKEPDYSKRKMVYRVKD